MWRTSLPICSASTTRIPRADFATLRALHLAHLYTVPFENLDVHGKRPIVLDVDRLFEKIVMQRRGGFCYELNGLFAWLLDALGYDVTLLSARVAQADGEFGAEYDHLTLLVRAPGQPSSGWLADVGFGDSFMEPLDFHAPGEQVQEGRAYWLERLEGDGEQYALWRRERDGSVAPQYRFTLQPRAYADFAAMCEYHQTSPASTFTQKRVCTLAVPAGRVTLTDSSLIMNVDGRREERPVRDEAEREAAAACVLRYCFVHCTGGIIPASRHVLRVMASGGHAAAILRSRPAATIRVRQRLQASVIRVCGLGKTYRAIDVDRKDSGIALWLQNLSRLTSNAATATVALSDISFQVEAGEVLGIFGANGAGKTTLIKILSGLLRPDSGTVSIQGESAPDRLKGLVSYVSTNGWMGLEWQLTAYENLLLYGNLFGLGGAELRRRCDVALEMVEMTPNRHKKISELSAGMRQKITLARGLVLERPVLYLDEPTVSLDVQSSAHVRELVSDSSAAQGLTVLIASHNPVDLSICDRILLLHQGRLIAAGRHGRPAGTHAGQNYAARHARGP